MKKKNKQKQQQKTEPTKQKKSRPQWQAQRKEPVLRFSPTAWAKLLYFRDKSDNEVGGFAVTSSDDLLFVEDFVTVKQEVTCVSVKFNDDAVADFFEQQVDQGRRPEQFARIWVHTHPADSPLPSGTDEATFTRVFGSCDWALMFVIAENDKTYARLSFNTGPGGQVLIPARVDYSLDFPATDRQAWDAEYSANVLELEWRSDGRGQRGVRTEVEDVDLPYHLIEDFENMDPAERQFVLDELSSRPELWDQEEVLSI